MWILPGFLLFLTLWYGLKIHQGTLAPGTQASRGERTCVCLQLVFSHFAACGLSEYRKMEQNWFTMEIGMKNVILKCLFEVHKFFSSFTRKMQCRYIWKIKERADWSHTASSALTHVLYAPTSQPYWLQSCSSFERKLTLCKFKIHLCHAWSSLGESQTHQPSTSVLNEVLW